MIGRAEPLSDFMMGAKRHFIIPVYQRNYEWRIENCKQLFDDLVKVEKSGAASHFFGSIVSAYQASGRSTNYLVIDGQQRLTTVTLLLLAMYNLIVEGKVTLQDPNIENEIYEQFLVDKYQSDATKIKLKPVKNDQKALEGLFGDGSNRIASSHLTANYEYFYDRIQKNELSIDDLYNAIFKLQIINIELQENDNPQLIFESLNSTGLDLSEGDKIRNFILMGQPANLQDIYYENYWNKIETNVQYDVSMFIRDYLSIKIGRIPPQKQIYKNFKEYAALSEGITTKEMLNDLLVYSENYKILLNGKSASKKIDDSIYRLNRLETTVTRPFLLEVLKLMKEGQISVSDAELVFELTESYVFRRFICDIPTNALNKIFLTLHGEIMRFDGTTDNYVEKMKYLLSSKKEKARFPTDEEFANAFSERQLYLVNSKNKIYTLERLENYGTLETKALYENYDAGVYTIEHIMPQSLTSSWEKELGNNFAEIHENWLHRIANLTLTAYNSSYSNNSFEKKKTMSHGFEESGLRMNTYISQFHSWGLPEIERRDRDLRKRALQVWSYPKTKYLPLKKAQDFVSLDEDDDLTGKKITKLEFRKYSQPVKSWLDAYVAVLRLLDEEDKTILNQLAEGSPDDIPAAKYFSTDSTELRQSHKLTDNIFIEANTSTQSKLSILRQLFDRYGIAYSDLTFYLSGESEEAQSEPVPQTDKDRFEYWSGLFSALAGITGPIQRSQKSWGGGRQDVYRINKNSMIKCIAVKKRTSVLLQFEPANQFNAEEISEMYQSLFSQKDEFEAQLGAELIWDDDKGGGRPSISIDLPNTTYSNRVDWDQMRKFHTEWVGNFKEAFSTPVEEQFHDLVKKDSSSRPKKIKEITRKVPDGKYHLSINTRDNEKAEGTMIVKDGKFIVQKGSKVLSPPVSWRPKQRAEAVIKDGILQEDVVCNSPSIAGFVVLGRQTNGWYSWKNEDGEPLNIYRQKAD
jgi:uncharacterized protein with ParB-like and HNH nuclease domain